MRSLFYVLFLCSISLSYSKDYILNTKTCKIPDMPYSYPEINKYIKPKAYISCNESELLSHVEKNWNSTTGFLAIRKHLIPLHVLAPKCCYSYVRRDGTPKDPDIGIHTTECRNFSSPLLVKESTILVKCTDIFSRVFYKNIHNPIIVTKQITSKAVDNLDKRFNVLVLVIESVSQLNFKRSMNKAYNYLKSNKFVEMKGYTKINDHTYSNVISLFTGLNNIQAGKQCNATKVGGLDECPFIWYDYRKNGYITAYGQDYTNLTAFNNQKKGFKHPPTDYYFKPYIEATETILDAKWFDNMPYCTGPESAGDRILNLAKDFVLTFKEKSSFGVFWMNTFSHEDVNAPSRMNQKLEQFFKDLKENGIFDKTIVMLLSDHGAESNELKMTKSGYWEERMPINMIRLPEKFQRRFRLQNENFMDSAKKLLSPYDMYMTLQHILTFSESSYVLKLSRGCPKCSSIFDRIPFERSCGDAGITPFWCTCVGYLQPLDLRHRLAKEATRLTAQKLNANITSKKWEVSSVIIKTVLAANVSEAFDRNNRHISLFYVTHTGDCYLTTIIFSGFVDFKSSFYFKKLPDSFCVEPPRSIDEPIAEPGQHRHLSAGVIGTAVDSQFPWLVGIYITKPRTSVFCIGNIIGKSWILTAARCVYRGRKAELYPGTIDLHKNKVYEVIYANEFFVHEKYRRDINYCNIALIKLKRLLCFDVRVRPIRLPTVDDKIHIYSKITVPGWGHTEDYYKYSRLPLRYSESLIISNNECQFYYREDKIFENEFCSSAGADQIHCYANYGTSAIIYSETPVIVGIFTFHGRPCNKSFPLGFSKVIDFRDWIRKITDI